MMGTDGRLSVLAEIELGDPKQSVKAAVRSGLAIVLCKPGGKDPVCTEPPSRRNGKHPEGGCGRNHAITDPELAYRAFEYAQSQYPGQALNLGVHARKSRLAFVDLDTPDQLDAFIAAYQKHQGADIPLTVNSPGKQDEDGSWVHFGAGHIYFDTTGIDLPEDAGEYVHPEDGWVMLWGNEHVVAPPSVRKEGSYTFSSPEVFRMPQWLTDLAWRKVNDRKPRGETGEPTEIDEWAERSHWSELLKQEHGWVFEGRRDNCGCPIWWLHGHGDHKSATAHEAGCPRYDTSRGHGPLHLWTTEPPDFLRGEDKNFSKIQYLAHSKHHGDMKAAMRSVGIDPTTASNEDLGWDPLEDNDDEPAYPVLPDEFWEAREDLKKIRRTAHALDCSEDPALFGILAWLAGAVPPACRVNTGILDHRGASLNLGVAVIGEPGAGKSTSQAVRRKLYRSPLPREKFAEGRPGGSGEGLVELYWGTEEEQITGEDGKTKWKPIRKQIRNNAYVWVPEGAYLFKINGRKGTTLFEVFRSAIFGESVGQSNASKETTRWLDDGNYALGYMVGFQPHTAMPLLTADEIAAGSPQRLLFCSPDNLVPEDVPELDEPEPAPFADPFGVADTVLDIRPQKVECPQWLKTEIRARRRESRPQKGRARVKVEPMDEHAYLTRTKIAALLALLENRYEISELDWKLACMVWDTSCKVRDSLIRYRDSRARREDEQRDKAAIHRQVRIGEALNDAAEKRAEEKVVKAAIRMSAKVRSHNPATKRDLDQCIRGADKKDGVHDDARIYGESKGWFVLSEDGKYLPGESQPDGR